MSDWLTYSPISGHGNGIITITANTLSSLEDRVATIIVSNSQHSLSASTSVTQQGSQLTAITFENVTWVTDVPSSGGTATKDNCSYTIVSHYADGTTGDITEYVTVSGSLNVAATTTVDRHDAGTLTLSASYSEFTASANVTVYQTAPSITGISFNNLTWVTDIAGTGGTATSANCSFNIYAYYTNGGSNYVDVTDATTVSGYVVVPESISENRHSAGTLTLTATYSTLTASSYITIYQEAYVTANYFTIEVISGGTIMWQNAPSFNFVIGSLGNVEEGDIIKLGVRKVSTTRASAGKIVGSDGVKFRVKGNIMSLFWPESSDFENKTNFPNETTFYNQLDGFLENNEGLIDASELILPATALTSGCYSGMFRNCTNLNGAPTLPLAIPVKNEIGLSAELYYQSMFAGCTSLTTAPELPATTLGYNCYISMFEGCTGLTTAPELPATNLTPHCYDSMFRGCTSLRQSPELPATTLVDGCYYYMFDGCTNLQQITCLATNISGNFCFDFWVRGVSQTGRFIKSPNMSSWETATISNHYAGIPEGWVITDYTVELTGITLSNLTWINDIPASGGTADKNNCTYTVYANYSNGDYVDITSDATVNGSLVVTSTTATTRENVGTLTLTAVFLGFTDSDSIDVYQEGDDTPTGLSDYLTFNILSSGTIVWKAQYDDTFWTKEIQYSLDEGSTWTSIRSSTDGTIINVNNGDKVLFKGDNNTYDTNSFRGSTAKFELEGNIMSLIDSTGFATATTLTGDSTFSSLFSSCTGLTDASKLVLPATTLANSCYSSMFFGCTSLTTAPSTLPSTTLVQNCYAYMFRGCTSLRQAPELPARTLLQYSYNQMFYECTSLNYIKCLAKNISADSCTKNWVYGVGSNGTFVKSTDMNDWATGDKGIPSGWTVTNAS